MRSCVSIETYAVAGSKLDGEICVTVPSAVMPVMFFVTSVQSGFAALAFFVYQSLPSFDREAIRGLVSFGIFSWIQAVSGILFGQVDRLITGVYLGAAAAASYALCAQLAQPIYGIAASGLHFLFPHVSARITTDSVAPLRRMSGLVANFVDIARFEDAAVKPHCTLNHLKELLAAALDDLYPDDQDPVES